MIVSACKLGILITWICFIVGTLSQAGVGEGQAPIGAYRVFPKTSFACLDRPAGYYADIEAGCQVYHMCDGLGRQFSYSCPNTTLFQQRMLICDHWYMVNCSRAENDYSANLLIGQRDKPFVPEDENQLRTPRPDLLDRPYAPDYSGESFRNQYKFLSPVENQIDSDGQKNLDKSQFQGNSPSPIRWRIQHSSYNVSTTRNPIVAGQQKKTTRPHPTISRRSDEVEENTSASDLGTSFSSNYNTSSDISTEQLSLDITTDSNVIIPLGEHIPIKIPSKVYEPPFKYPVYNENYTETTEIPTTTVPTPTKTTKRLTTTTTAPFRFLTKETTFSSGVINPTIPVSTTPLPPTLPIQTATPKYSPLLASTTTKKPTNKNYEFSKYFNLPPTTTTYKPDSSESTTSKLSTIPTLATDFLPPHYSDKDDSESSSENSDNSGSIFDFDVPLDKDKQFPIPTKNVDGNKASDIPKLSLEILPPFPEYVSYDIATTQGPPIYYEWKVPSNSLEPPKLDSPTGADSKETKDNTTNTKDDKFNNKNDPFQFSHNPFLSAVINRNKKGFESSTKSPTPRSIQTQQSFNIASQNAKDSNKTAPIEPPTEEDIHRLQQELLIPDFLFPLEREGRTGYEHSDTLNSFQLKIPERRSDDQKWYGENPDCPECHPSFVKPGTCEPCVKRR